MRHNDTGKKKNRSNLAGVLAAAALTLLSAGCAKEELSEDLGPSGGELAFSAYAGSQLSADDEAKAAMESQVIELRSDDGSVVIPMVVRVSDGIESLRTKGAPINNNRNGDHSPIPLSDTLHTMTVHAFRDGISVFEEGDSLATWNATAGKWQMGRPYYWPAETLMDFYAYANMPTKDVGYVKMDLANQKQTLHYEVPDHTDKQTDILMAMYSGNGGGRGQAELDFKHPLAAIQFRRDPSAEDLEGTISITMENVYYIGEAEQSMVDPGVFEWTLIAKGQSVTQDNHGLPLIVHGGIDGDPFLLIPQEVTDEGIILLRVEVLINGHRVPLNAVISRAFWDAGKTYTYIVGYSGGLKVDLEADETSETEKGAAVVKNTDVRTAYVRAMLMGYIINSAGAIKSSWVNDDGTNKGEFTVASGDFDSETEAWNKRPDGKGGWIKGADGFYYYRYPVKTAAEGSNGDPDAQTTPLFNSYRISDIGLNNHFQLDIAVQSVEYDKDKDYVLRTWGEYAASLLETME